MCFHARAGDTAREQHSSKTFFQSANILYIKNSLNSFKASRIHETRLILMGKEMAVGGFRTAMFVGVAESHGINPIELNFHFIN